MKVYVVMESALVAGEECERLMGVFSSAAKANDAVEAYEKHVYNSCWHYEYYCIECEVDQLWEQ
jgi:hypothetical protein